MRGWLKTNLFSSVPTALVTLLLGGIALWFGAQLLSWAVVRAQFTPDLQACTRLAQAGACWGFVAEKLRVILFGGYPYAEQWRPAAATVLLLALLAASGLRALWRPALALLWIAGIGGAILLLAGGVAGLPAVESSRWGGLPLTLLLTLIGALGAFPLGLLLALGRRSRLPVIRRLCVFYIELVRGLPLITVLFMASFLIPLLTPGGLSLPALARVQIGIVLFEAAYLAEVVRGGLQAIPRGQHEAAAALGLAPLQSLRLIVLPQALRIVIPPLVNNFIGALKSTSLVLIVGLHDLTGALRLAVSDPAWRAFALEGYLFIGAVYFVLCFSLSRYSRRLETRLRRND
jgi:general L-amino acid transport system permease protein